jgi:hypothetical protein
VNFLEIVKDVRRLIGVQGEGPALVESAVGVELVICDSVKYAFVDIQNLRQDFRFLDETKTFNTQVGKDNYLLTEIFNTVPEPQFRSYQKDTFRITAVGTKRVLRYRDYKEQELRYLNISKTEIPSEFSIGPKNDITLKDTPNGVYTVSFRYYRSPQILVESTDIPILPTSFHRLITYKALERMAVYLGQPEIFRAYALETVKMSGQLMRDQVPKQRFSTGALV